MEANNKLFVGEHGADQQLSALFLSCPAEYQSRDNQWYQLASIVCFRKGADVAGWVFKHPEQRDEHLQWLASFVQKEDGTPREVLDMKTAVLAWALASMLETCPTYRRREGRFE